MSTAALNTKQVLIETAQELIWQNSYSAVSVDEICKTAHVNKGSFYHFFSSKMDLALSAMEHHYTTFKTHLDKVFSKEHAPMKRFELLSELVYNRQKDSQNKYGKACGCPFATLASELAGKEDALQLKTEEIFNDIQSYYQATLRDMATEGQIPSDTCIATKAKDIFAYIMGQILIARMQNNLDHLEQHLKAGLFQMIGINPQFQEP